MNPHAPAVGSPPERGATPSILPSVQRLRKAVQRRGRALLEGADEEERKATRKAEEVGSLRGGI
jgi:hypothetical protein